MSEDGMSRKFSAVGDRTVADALRCVAEDGGGAPSFAAGEGWGTDSTRITPGTSSFPRPCYARMGHRRRAVANRMKRHNRYPVTRSIGYPTPGSLGTWAGVERGIPTITLELPARHSTKRCWVDNRAALLLL